MGDEISQGLREVEFHILGSLHDPDPIIVRRGCLGIDFAPVSDFFARVPWGQSKPSRDSVEFLPV